MKTLVVPVALLFCLGTADQALADAGAKPSPASTTPAPPSSVQTDSKYDELSHRVDVLEAQLQQSEMQQAADHQKVASWQPVSGWWDNTSISGRMYYDITNVNNKNNGVASTANGTSFDIKRFYVGIDHTFNDIFSANVTTDFTYDSTTAVTQVYVKKAYLQAKLDDAFTVRIGSADMPWIAYVEDSYGYRYVENTLIDRVKFGTSADWGVHVLGKFADGLLAYQFSAVNGNGYKKPGFIGLTNRTAGLDVEGRVSLNYEGFQLGVGGYDGKLGAPHGTARETASRLDALAAYTAMGFRVGVEYFAATNYAYGGGTSSATTKTNGNGYSTFASYQFDPQWGVFSRYDYVKPYSDTALAALKSFHNTYYNFGISYSPAKIIDFALVYKHDAGSNGFIADQDGTIGGSAFAPGNSGAYNEIGLWGQVRW